MKAFLILWAAAVLALAPPLHAQSEQEPQVQIAEAQRRGDMVVIMGEGPRASEDQAYVAAMAPPADDSHLWYVTVWTTPGCQACEHLKSDFRKAPELTCFVAAPQSGALAWAHYIEYSGADETQKDRREKYKVTAFPTIVIQPPRNKMWGDPALVVFYQTGYDGDAKGLATKIQRAVRRFADVQSRKGFPKQAQAAPTLLPLGSTTSPFPAVAAAFAYGRPSPEGASQEAGVNPPFPTPPKVDPFNPTVTPVQTQPGPATTWPPSEQPSGGALQLLLSLIGQLLVGLLPSGSTMTATLMLILVGLKVWEVRAKQTPAKWDDNAIAFVRSLIARSQNPTDPPSPGPTPPATP